MLACPSCGHENADDARFCSQCATRLEGAAPEREERKVVTCLFCDLVGFTRAERLEAGPPGTRRRRRGATAYVRRAEELLAGAGLEIPA